MDNSKAKKDFITAFWFLYEKNPVEKISIRKLCEIAGYNRSTFYNHFGSIYVLLDAAIDDLFADSDFPALDCRSIPELASVSRDVVPAALAQLEKDRHYISLLIRNHNEGILKERLKNMFLSHLTIQHVEKYPRISLILEYHLSACMSVIVKWFHEDSDISEVELADLIYDLTQNGSLPSLFKEIGLMEGLDD